MIVLGLILFVFAGWGLVGCLCRAAALEPPDYEQRSHVEVLRFVDVVTLMDGDTNAR